MNAFWFFIGVFLVFLSFDFGSKAIKLPTTTDRDVDSRVMSLLACLIFAAIGVVMVLTYLPKILG